MTLTELPSDQIYMIEVRDHSDIVLHSRLTASWPEVEAELLSVLWEHSSRTEASAEAIATGLAHARNAAVERKRSYAIDVGSGPYAKVPVSFEVIPIAR